MTDLITKHGGDLIERRVAVFSRCERYRYVLEIIWDDHRPRCQFIGLNPSTADEMKDDPTLRRVKSFAKDWGCGSVKMTNLFAYRATDPREMKKQLDPVGPRNDELLRISSVNSIHVVAGWANHGSFRGRDAEVLMVLNDRRVECLRMTKAGNPEHPLYMPQGQGLSLFQANKMLAGV